VSTSTVTWMGTLLVTLILMGLDALTHLSNFSAGAGDFLSAIHELGNITQRVLGHRAIPMSELLRQELVCVDCLNDVVDQCSAAYAAGKYTV